MYALCVSEFKLPDRILPAFYFSDDFEDVDDDSDDDDEACLLALQEAEKRMATEKNSS